MTGEGSLVALMRVEALRVMAILLLLLLLLVLVLALRVGGLGSQARTLSDLRRLTARDAVGEREEPSPTLPPLVLGSARGMTVGRGVLAAASREDARSLL